MSSKVQYLNENRAWFLYLEALSDYQYRNLPRTLFFKKLKEYLRPGLYVHKWPGVWPELNYILGGKIAEAVQAGLQAEGRM